MWKLPTPDLPSWLSNQAKLPLQHMNILSSKHANLTNIHPTGCMVTHHQDHISGSPAGGDSMDGGELPKWFVWSIIPLPQASRTWPAARLISFLMGLMQPSISWQTWARTLELGWEMWTEKQNPFSSLLHLKEIHLKIQNQCNLTLKGLIHFLSQ